MWVCKNCGKEVILITQRIHETKHRVNDKGQPILMWDGDIIEEVRAECTDCKLRGISLKDIAKWREENESL